jgi:chromosome partitioning protein
MSARIFTITNQKGGVGKTTTAVTVASGLARQGKRVLIIDLDPQGQCATALGVNPEPCLLNLLLLPGHPRQWVRETGRDNLSIIPGDRSTDTAQIVLNAQNRDVAAIATAVAPLTPEYDYIFFDTAPSAGGLQERAIWASQKVIIPSATEFLSLDGLMQIVNLLDSLTRKRDWRGELFGVLPTFYDTTTRQSKQAYDALKQAFGPRCLSPIRRSTLLRECPSDSLTIWEKDPSSVVAGDYQKLVDLVSRK